MGGDEALNCMWSGHGFWIQNKLHAIRQGRFYFSQTENEIMNVQCTTRTVEVAWRVNALMRRKTIAKALLTMRKGKGKGKDNGHKDAIPTGLESYQQRK